nr:threonine/serine exporter family protein [Endozoicomonas sp. OPT23]
MCLFKLYFGAVLGGAIGNLLWGTKAYVFTPGIPEWTEWLAVPLLSLSLIIIFKSRIKDAFWSVMSCITAYIGSLIGAAYLGDSLGLFVGALLVGLYSNIYSRITNAPSTIVLLHGVVLLVPGSKAYIGLNKMVSGETILNFPEIGTQTFLIFMSILAGLMFANTLLPSRKPL